MPIYDYRCHQCQMTFSLQASMNEPAPTQGPQCASQKCEIRKSLNRVFGQVAGAHKAPNLPTLAPAKPKGPEPHVCAKYCDQHR